MRRTLWLILIAAAFLPLAGCDLAQLGLGSTNGPEPASAKPSEVLVSVPIERQVTDFEDFTGRTDAVAAVELRAQVNGYLEKLNFTDGSDVKKGDVLFLVDDRPYTAELHRAQATLKQAEAHVKRLEADLRRATALLARRAIGREEYDRIAADRAEAEAAVGIARASLETAKLNLEFTRVIAPISGRISRRMVDPGNLVQADDTLLTTIVALDPMYAYFDIDERTLLGLQRRMKEGQIASAAQGGMQVEFGLADEDGCPHTSMINFLENKIDPATGTLRVRGIFSNKDQVLAPGLFVRVRVPVGASHTALLVNEQALGTDQGRRFLYVVNAKNEIVYRPVDKVGGVYDGLRVVEDHLFPGERVIVSGMQRVRPGATVAPKLVDMVTLEAPRAPGAVASKKPAQGAVAAEPPKVHVSVPIEREVTEHEDFTGRTDAVASVEVRARVTGYLQKLNFNDGTDVKAGDLLFQIDQRPYEAEVESAQATLVQSQARVDRLEADFARASSLKARDAIGREEYDRIVGDRAEAEAALDVARATLELAKLNLEFTEVKAPISGRISRRLIDPGNLVKADETPLTTIVTLDRMYAYFDIDERTLLRLRRLVRAGKIESARERPLAVLFGLADEEGYPHTCTINFVDNRVDSSTGTLSVRGIFPNADRLLTTGLFVRVRVPVGAPHKALLVHEQALSIERGKRFVYVVNADDEVVQRPVTIGPLKDGLRVIETGVSRGERVVVSGLQRVRPGIKVAPQTVLMTEPDPPISALETPARKPAAAD